MKKAIKVILIIFLSFFVILGGFFTAYLIITRDAKLDESKLLSPDKSVIIVDADGNEITGAVSGNAKSVKIEDLQEHTKNAFIASEDRKFYEHNGLNYGRMVKAFFTNLKSKSFKEGASTISQQLIKNTHLSSDKTIKRKLNEIRLTKQLERRYEKDEILEMYVNTIYFGHSSYGLQSAAEFYFDKRAENLTLEESALVVGLLSSPNNYSPFRHPEKSLTRRNLVLKAMADCGFITAEEYETAKEKPLGVVESGKKGQYSDYLKEVFAEMDEKIDGNAATGKIVVKTYMDKNLQAQIENLEFDSDNAIIVTENSGGVSAFKSTIGNAKRQPGSTIKPLAVYAPAFEERALSPFTRILDEKIDYNGYSPENYDKKYHGYVTVTDSIKYSYNVPAVKTLNNLTVARAEKYLGAMDLQLEDGEKNLSLALGGMQHGLSLKEICDRYAIFPDGGAYSSSHFIREISLSDGKTLYKEEKLKSPVFSRGTCSLINEILLETSKSGTAKKLGDCKFDVATKTGTCGTAEGNTDAYSISYTSRHCVGVWLGDKDNARLPITGGKDCCAYAHKIFDILYSESAPERLDVDSGTVKVEIDVDEYRDNNRILLCDPLSPAYARLQVKVLAGNEPREYSTKFSRPTIAQPKISVENNCVNIELCQTKYYAYEVIRAKNGKNEVIYDGIWKNLICDEPPDGSYEYFVTPYFLSGETKICGEKIKIATVNVGDATSSPQVKIPDISKKNWYDL